MTNSTSKVPGVEPRSFTRFSSKRSQCCDYFIGSELRCECGLAASDPTSRLAADLTARRPDHMQRTCIVTQHWVLDARRPWLARSSPLCFGATWLMPTSKRAALLLLLYSIPALIIIITLYHIIIITLYRHRRTLKRRGLLGAVGGERVFGCFCLFSYLPYVARGASGESGKVAPFLNNGFCRVDFWVVMCHVQENMQANTRKLIRTYFGLYFGRLASRANVF